MVDRTTGRETNMWTDNQVDRMFCGHVEEDDKYIGEQVSWLTGKMVDS